ncbi:fungal-specific transcription factor domain-domain-containing protein [Clohesyomyces aquaticus]|uniref:Fungal-specific transcription factor domain-domain-containing protein n=1 Tax=Clohesyomyces aquaticus TaxID=1231657 RepID=A0A1Y1ZN50_9PLEO|nr:fungal-specific transcription factor domain-domain-containing protein [Clohesyomyces aquaticus]
MAMSSLTAQPAEAQKPENTNNATAVPKKRRRRAPATGAAEDCFACRKRQVKCDRRRPYCGQCLEIGKDCSGYRTTLTWGVGVASRGKLRGMALPIAKSAQVNTSTQGSKTQTSTASVSGSASAAQPAKTQRETRGSIDFGAHSPTSPTSPNIYPTPQEYLHLGPTSPIPIPSPTTPMGFTVPSYGEHVDAYHPHSSKLRRPHLHRGPLQRLHTTLAVPFDESVLSASTGSLSTYSDSDYPSPGEWPNTPDDFPFAESSLPPYHSLIFNDHTPMSSTENLHHFHEAPRSFPIADDVSSSISSDQSIKDFVEANSGQRNMGAPSFSDIFMEGEMSGNCNGLPQPGYAYLPSEGMSSIGSGVMSSDESALTTSIPQSPFPATHLSPRMLYLLDYYDKFICPVLVAFDSPANPYRMHVMHLAMQSEGLQNAIAALATNNMRMRGGIEGRRLSFAQDSRLLPDHAFSQMTTQELREMHGEPSHEEQRHKANSIALLNMKLADPNGTKDDSVLATLLILCLFHVCDSGFTKFKTQLAGVQKLLSMRDRTVQSNFVGWIELFFTWFDVMTSTVNDRETEVQGDSLDMADLTANLGALEHLAGCEGRLFKLIARLGRLNLLSQNRPVRENNNTPRATPQPKRQREYYSFNFDTLDGNGWGTRVTESASPTTPTADEARTTFWAEWNDIRTRLQEWEIDMPSGLTANSCGAASSGLALSPSQAAVLHISESFRYAALLYTERLAHPTPSSSALNFQNLVAQGLYHISQIGITSCVNKFLLWPLFIIGTECVDPEHRAIVRQRCIEIQRESGFFNNVSGLEVLEKVWQEDDERENREMVSLEHGPFGAKQQAFRWRKAMGRIDGEYIVL